MKEREASIMDDWKREQLSSKSLEQELVKRTNKLAESNKLVERLNQTIGELITEQEKLMDQLNQQQHLTNSAIKKLTPKNRKSLDIPEESEEQRLEELLNAKVDELEAALEEIEGYKAQIEEMEELNAQINEDLEEAQLILEEQDQRLLELEEMNGKLTAECFRLEEII